MTDKEILSVLFGDRAGDYSIYNDWIYYKDIPTWFKVKVSNEHGRVYFDFYNANVGVDCYRFSVYKDVVLGSEGSLSSSVQMLADLFKGRKLEEEE